MKGNIRKLSLFLTVLYLLLLSYWMMYGFGRSPQEEYMYSLQPFSTIHHYLQIENFNTNTRVINLIGNIGVFIPFGVLLPVVIQRRFIIIYIIFFCGLFFLELMQLLSKRGSFDVDDFILNSLGFMIGYWIYRIIALKVYSRRGGIA